MFHVRGNIAPSVLNPSLDTYREIAGEMMVYAIPGNHDLEGNDSHRVSNAVTAISTVGVFVAHEPQVIEITPDWAVALFPWFYRVEDLIEHVDKDSTALVMNQDGQLFQISEKRVWTVRPLAAIGSGGDLALGWLSAMQVDGGPDPDVRSVVRRALKFVAGRREDCGGGVDMRFLVDRTVDK